SASSCLIAARTNAHADEYPFAFAAFVISCSSASLNRRVILQVFRAIWASKSVADKWRTHHRFCLPPKAIETTNKNGRVSERVSANPFMFHYRVFAALHEVAPLEN